MALTPALESKREQLAAALTARLGTIDAETPDPLEPTRARFHYAPTHVLRVDELDVKHLHSQHEAIYQVMPGDGFPDERTTGSFQNQMEVFVLAARRWQPNTQDPYGIQPPIRETIQNRLLRDIKIALYDDVTLGGLAINTEIKDENLNIQIQDSFPWAVVEARIVITYEHAKEAP
jgi:hypothetical protein